MIGETGHRLLNAIAVPLNIMIEVSSAGNRMVAKPNRKVCGIMISSLSDTTTKAAFR